MNGFQTKAPTAHAIDEACRLGYFCFYGNRQGILGAVQHRNGELAIKGRIWIHKASDLSWEYVDARSIIITTERFSKGDDMAGKKAGSKKGVKRSKKGARANNDNQELPGVGIDQRRIPAIEDAEEARQSASAALSQAHEDLEEAVTQVIMAMHDNGFDPKKRPVYTRNPWGTVILTQKGEVKEKVKFTAYKEVKKKKDEEESGE